MDLTVHENTSNMLPYDAFEYVLKLLDGVSLLAVKCVCRHWSQQCEQFIGSRPAGFWKKCCLQELSESTIDLCQSGHYGDENWLAVYKSAHVHNTINSRTLNTYAYNPLAQIMPKERTGVHIFGSMFILIQMTLLSMYDIMSGKLISTLCVGQRKAHYSYVIRKSTPGSNGLPCDVLVLLLGGAEITHLMVLSVDLLLNGKLMTPLAIDPLSSASTTSSPRSSLYQCSTHPDHIVTRTACVKIDASKQNSITLEKVNLCPEKFVHSTATSADKQRSGYAVALSTNVVARQLRDDAEDNDEIQLTSDTQDEIKIYKTIPIKGKLVDTSDQRLVARMVHIGDGVIPVIATLSRSDVKLVELHTLNYSTSKHAS